MWPVTASWNVGLTALRVGAVPLLGRLVAAVGQRGARRRAARRARFLQGGLQGLEMGVRWGRRWGRRGGRGREFLLKTVRVSEKGGGGESKGDGVDL